MPETKSHLTSVRLSAELRGMIDALIARNGSKISAVIERAVRDLHRAEFGDPVRKKIPKKSKEAG